MIQKKNKLLKLVRSFLHLGDELLKSESVEKIQYADVIIRNSEGKVLLLHRTYTDNFEPGKWSLPGGHVDEGEDALTAAVREVKEETGLDVIAYPIEVKEKDNCVIHYYQSMVMTDKGQNLDSNIILDIEEHRGYEWIEPSKLKEYDLVCDLGSYIDDLVGKLFQFTIIKPQYTNAEEAIANLHNDGSLDQAWEVLCKAFDEDKITPEQFVKAREQYNIAKKKEALQIIAKALDLGMINEEQYMDALVKAGDPSHGGKLVKKIITDKKGKMVTKWVDRETGEEPVKEKKPKAAPQEQWWSKFKQYNLNAYPIGIDQKDVEVNEGGDINSHWVLKWKDPKSGAIKNAYTREFLQRNADKKWERISNVSAKDVQNIKKKSVDLMINEDVNYSIKDAAAIIAIIAHTGLRRGDKLKFGKTGNRGISTLSPENVTIEGDTIKLNFRGKSYQENSTEFTEPKVATYLKYLVEHRKGEEFLFNTTDAVIDSTFDKVGGEGLKIKDMRTYVATDLARKLLFEDQTPPPPVPEDLSVTKKKKLVQDKLKGVYEKVADRLCNTPTMAKTSYIHPNVIDTWLKKLKLDFEFQKSFNVEELRKAGEEAVDEVNFPSLDDIIAAYTCKHVDNIDEDSEEECDEFNLPEWWDESEDELRKAQSIVEEYFEKGGKEAAKIGEIREFGGKRYIKTDGGWKYHGTGQGEKAKKHRKDAQGMAPIKEGSQITTHKGVKGEVIKRTETHTYIEHADEEGKSKVSKVLNEHIDAHVESEKWKHHVPADDSAHKVRKDKSQKK